MNWCHIKDISLQGKKIFNKLEKSTKQQLNGLIMKVKVIAKIETKNEINNNVFRYEKH